MRSLRSRMCLRLASALAALANVPPVWVFWWRKGSPCSYNHAAIHTYPFPLPFNPSPIKPPSRFRLGACGPCGRLGQSGCCPLRAQRLVLSPTGLCNDICSRLIIWLRGALAFAVRCVGPLGLLRWCVGLRFGVSRSPLRFVRGRPAVAPWPSTSKPPLRPLYPFSPTATPPPRSGNPHAPHRWS